MNKCNVNNFYVPIVPCYKAKCNRQKVVLCNFCNNMFCDTHVKKHFCPREKLINV